jgi:hypothetical protein
LRSKHLKENFFLSMLNTDYLSPGTHVLQS